jgi:tRNA (guanine37-N1)-methyltransferase
MIDKMFDQPRLNLQESNHENVLRAKSTTLMKIHVLTLFPDIIDDYLGQSMMKRASTMNLVEFHVHNIRDYTFDKHHVADDSPYGGGPGMVMKPEPIAAAFDAIALQREAQAEATVPRRIYLSPQGVPWAQQKAEELAGLPEIILLCGHYEGVDERVIENYIDEEISIGDYVLTGGELPALVLIDSIARLVPGVLGNNQSAQFDSFSDNGLLDHPHYTRPEVFRDQAVPPVLLSGNHAEIDKWRRNESLLRTAAKRPDLLEKIRDSLTDKERVMLTNSPNQVKE